MAASSYDPKGDEPTLGPCEHCGGPIHEDGKIVALVAPDATRTKNQVHIWVHPECWEPYKKARH